VHAGSLAGSVEVSARRSRLNKPTTNNGHWDHGVDFLNFFNWGLEHGFFLSKRDVFSFIVHWVGLLLLNITGFCCYRKRGQLPTKNIGLPGTYSLCYTARKSTRLILCVSYESFSH